MRLKKKNDPGGGGGGLSPERGGGIFSILSIKLRWKNTKISLRLIDFIEYMRSRWVYIVYAKDPANLIIIIYFQTRSATRTTPPVDKMSRFSGFSKSLGNANYSSGRQDE